MDARRRSIRRRISEIPPISAAARIAGFSEVNYTTPRTPSPKTPAAGSAKPASSGGKPASADAEETTTRRPGARTTARPGHDDKPVGRALFAPRGPLPARNPTATRTGCSRPALSLGAVLLA